MSTLESYEYSESTSTTLEWKVTGLKTLFDGSVGEAKSKVTKSARFGGGRWQILFYANSGTDGGAYVSLYLSCEPTIEERENAFNGKWVRDGLFKFVFELRNTNKGTMYNTKEACDHSFSYKTANWGWAQFARRDHVYYSSNAVKQQDAFVIICTITSSPASPSPPSPIPRQFVPRDLVESFGALLDNPLYSDVEFVLPRQRGSGTRSILANKRLLQRAEYFNAMFNSGFAEASRDTLSANLAPSLSDGASVMSHSRATESETVRSFEQRQDDSDCEDDDDELLDNDVEVQSIRSRDEHDSSAGDTRKEITESSDATEETIREPEQMPNASVSTSWIMEKSVVPGPPRQQVIVRDVAYITYRAVLYYLYTNTIVFAPLSSSYPLNTPAPSLHNTPSSASLLRTSQGQGLLTASRTIQQSEEQSEGPQTRKRWLKEWQSNNPDRVSPCSAKAAYRLADMLDLTELKTRAFQHIVKSLTVHNVAYEMFSSFSARFEEVRTIQIDFFLSHWAEIRGSEVMRTIWQQIRGGRHPGFEQVWPLIAMNLEFKPTAPQPRAGDEKEASANIES
ncbi:hypothetical protein SISSUDRAFT_1041276 [Sistotremastrum suecicum HHB10207 ss-3]|uniref:MATH domain-containing protein n=1 Tax=Sistotremastrum suecicum HHB10207 ss-3 TaxID=1314776 RepID=A0A166HFJ7_9AGAM|nr:hypothetical protein SISSUDRAFT_1041276 [Sistotremastrum suecicum HHB10207 ss-3]